MASSLTTQSPAIERISPRRYLYVLYIYTLLLSLTGCNPRVVNPEDFSIAKRCVHCDSIRNDGVWIAEPDRYGLGPRPMILESDGTYLSISSPSECNADPSPVECHKAYMSDIEATRQLYGHKWGRFEIADDSIIINYIGASQLGDRPFHYEVHTRRGAVINDSTIIVGDYVKFFPQEHKRGILINDSTLFIGYYYRFFQEDLDIPETSWLDMDPRFD
ncbi:MAG: hypothetical protein AAFQ53_06140 [Bacteroidota bacterium]